MYTWYICPKCGYKTQYPGDFFAHLYDCDWETWARETGELVKNEIEETRAILAELCPNHRIEVDLPLGLVEAVYEDCNEFEGIYVSVRVNKYGVLSYAVEIQQSREKLYPNSCEECWGEDCCFYDETKEECKLLSTTYREELEKEFLDRPSKLERDVVATDTTVWGVETIKLSPVSLEDLKACIKSRDTWLHPLHTD